MFVVVPGITHKRLAVCAVAVFIAITYQVTHCVIKCTKLSLSCKPAIAYTVLLRTVAYFLNSSIFIRPQAGRAFTFSNR
jgi:hypothetical protein